MANNSTITKEILQRFLQLKDEVIAAKHCNTVKEFAAAVGEYAPNVYAMGKGTRMPTIEHIFKACSAFGYSANWLILNIGPRKIETELYEPIQPRAHNLKAQRPQVKRLIAKDKKASAKS